MPVGHLMRWSLRMDKSTGYDATASYTEAADVPGPLLPFV